MLFELYNHFDIDQDIFCTDRSQAQSIQEVVFRSV